MKMVSIAVDDAVYESAEKAAHKLNTSVSALLSEYLAGLARALQQPASGPGEQSEQERDRRERQELVHLLDRIPFELGRRVTREEIYDRPGLSGQ